MKTVLRSSLPGSTVLLTAMLSLVACTPPAADSVQDTHAYTALAALPDWSGTWATGSVDDPAGSVAFRDCCIGDGAQVPFTPKYAELRRRFGITENKRPFRNDNNHNNSAYCIPAGVPAVLAHPILFEFLYTPGRVTMIFNDGEIRKIRTDRTTHPPADELDIGFSGYSIGHWDNGSLQVDTRHIDPRADLFMANNLKVTANTQVTERMSLQEDGRLRIDTTVTDAEIFTRPYRYTLYYQRVPGDFEPGCAANNFENGLELKVPEL